MPLDLLVADLIPAPGMPAAMREARLPRAERWLARGNVATQPGDATAWLATQFGLPRPVPVAAIALAGEQAARSGAWMRADPVHLRIVEDHLELHDASVLDLDMAEALALVDALAAHFAADRLEWSAAAPGRWYVAVPEGELPRTTPLADAVGRDVYGLLPVAAAQGSINWRGAITEVQMVLASHEVNVQRERARKPTVNSVWFWGEGATPAIGAQPYRAVYADDSFARGLARLSGVEPRELPGSIDDIDLERSGDRALAVVSALGPALHGGGFESWRIAAQALDEQWFGGIGRAIERFGEVRVALPAGPATRVATLTPAARWRWFRGRRPLSSHA